LNPAHRFLRVWIAQIPRSGGNVQPARINAHELRSALEFGFDLLPQYQAFVHFAISAARLFSLRACYDRPS
jgi:hypothetical protein